MYLPCPASHENRKYSLTLDNFSLSNQQLVQNYFLYPSKGSDVYLQEMLAQFLLRDSLPFGNRRDPSEVVEKTDCRELLEVHRNVIDFKSIAFLMILLAPEDSFVTLHMPSQKDAVLTASTKKTLLVSPVTNQNAD